MSDTGDIPAPPREVLEPGPPRFVPDLEVPLWIQDAIVEPSGVLFNSDHDHLEYADLGVIWTSKTYERKGKRVLGEARLGEQSGSNKWANGRAEEQLERWFGAVPDFLITLDAEWWTQYRTERPAAVLALLEHELYHCDQETDAYGMPKFGRDGRPRWRIRPHDVEEFVGVARRYGAARDDLAELQAALESGPTVGEAVIDGICGRCLKAVA